MLKYPCAYISINLCISGGEKVILLLYSANTSTFSSVFSSTAILLSSTSALAESLVMAVLNHVSFRDRLLDFCLFPSLLLCKQKTLETNLSIAENQSNESESSMLPDRFAFVVLLRSQFERASAIGVNYLSKALCFRLFILNKNVKQKWAYLF